MVLRTCVGTGELDGDVYLLRILRKRTVAIFRQLSREGIKRELGSKLATEVAADNGVDDVSMKGGVRSQR
jgi:hypothetical protein